MPLILRRGDGAGEDTLGVRIDPLPTAVNAVGVRLQQKSPRGGIRVFQIGLTMQLQLRAGTSSKIVQIPVNE